MDSSMDIVAGVIDDNDLEAFAFLDEVTRSPTTQLKQEPTETNSSLDHPPDSSQDLRTVSLLQKNTLLELSQEPEIKSSIQKNTSLELPMVVSQENEIYLQKQNVKLLAQSVMKALALMQTSKHDNTLTATETLSSDALESGEIDSDSENNHLFLQKSLNERVDKYSNPEVPRFQFRNLTRTENDTYHFQSTATESLGQELKKDICGKNPYISSQEFSRFYELEVDSHIVRSLKRKKKKHSHGKKHKRKRNKSPNLSSENGSLSESRFKFSAISCDKVMLKNISKRNTPALSDDSDISAISMSSVKTVKRGASPKLPDIDLKLSESPPNLLNNLSSRLKSCDSILLDQQPEAASLCSQPPLLGMPKKRKKKKEKKSKKYCRHDVPTMDLIEPDSSLTSPDSIKSRRGSRLLDSSYDSSSPLRASCSKRKGLSTRQSESPHTRRHASASSSDKKKRKVKKLKKKHVDGKDKKRRIRGRSKSTGREISETGIPMCSPKLPQSRPCSSMSNHSRGSIEVINSKSLSPSRSDSQSLMNPLRLKLKPSNASRGSSQEMVQSNSQMLTSYSNEPQKELVSLTTLIQSNKTTRELDESIAVSRSIITSSLNSAEVIQEMNKSIAISKSVMSVLLYNENLSSGIDRERDRTTLHSPPKESVVSPSISESTSGQISNKRPSIELIEAISKPPAKASRSRSRSLSLSSTSQSRSSRNRSRSPQSRSRSSRNRSRPKTKRPSIELIEANSKPPAKSSRSRSRSLSLSSPSQSRSSRNRSRSPQTRSRSSRSRSRSRGKRRRYLFKSKKLRSSPLRRRETRSRSRRRSPSRSSFDSIRNSRRARGIRSNSRSPATSSALPRSRSRGRLTRSRSRSLGKFKRRPKSRSSRRRRKISSWRRTSRSSSRGRRSLSSRSLSPRLRRSSRRPRSMSSKRSLSPEISNKLTERDSLNIRDLSTTISPGPSLAVEQNRSAAATVSTVSTTFAPPSTGYSQTRNDYGYFAKPLNMVPYAYQSVAHPGQQSYQPYHYNVPSYQSQAQTFQGNTGTFGQLCSNPPPPGSNPLALANSVPPPNSYKPPCSSFLGSIPPPVLPLDNFQPRGSNFPGSLPIRVPPPTIGNLPSTDFLSTVPLSLPPPSNYKATSSDFRTLISCPVTLPTSYNNTLTGSLLVPQKKQIIERENMAKNGLKLCGGMFDTTCAGKSLSAPKPRNTSVEISPEENKAPQSSDDDFVSKPVVLIGKKARNEKIVINLKSQKKILTTPNGNRAKVMAVPMEKYNDVNLTRRNLIECKTSVAIQSRSIHSEADKPTLRPADIGKSPQELVNLEPLPSSCNITSTGLPLVPQKKQMDDGGNSGMVGTTCVGKSLSAPKHCKTSVEISLSPEENKALRSKEDDLVSKPSVLIGKKPINKSIEINLLSNKKKQVMEAKLVVPPLMDTTSNGNKTTFTTVPMEKCNEINLTRRNLVASKTSETVTSLSTYTEANKPALCSTNLGTSPQELVNLEPSPTSSNIMLTDSPLIIRKKLMEKWRNITRDDWVLGSVTDDTTCFGKSLNDPKSCNTSVEISLSPEENKASQPDDDDFVRKPLVLKEKKARKEKIAINLVYQKKKQVMEDSPLVDVTSNGNKAKVTSVPMKKCYEDNLTRRNLVAWKTSEAIQSQCILSEANKPTLCPTDLGKSPQELVNLEPLPTSCNITSTGLPLVPQKKQMNEGGNSGIVGTTCARKSLSATKHCNTSVEVSLSPKENKDSQSSDVDLVSKPSVLIGKKAINESTEIKLLCKKKKNVVEDSPLMDVTSNGNKANVTSVPMKKCNEVNLNTTNLVACKASETIESRCILSEADKPTLFLTDLGKSPKELVNLEPSPTSCNITLTDSLLILRKNLSDKWRNITRDDWVLGSVTDDTTCAGKSLSAPQPCNASVISLSPEEIEASQSEDEDFVSKPVVLVEKKARKEKIAINLLYQEKRQVMEDSPLTDLISNGNKAKVTSVPMEKCNEVNLSKTNLVACKASETIESQCILSEADKPTLCSTDLCKSPREVVNLEPSPTGCNITLTDSPLMIRKKLMEKWRNITRDDWVLGSVTDDTTCAGKSLSAPKSCNTSVEISLSPEENEASQSEDEDFVSKPVVLIEKEARKERIAINLGYQKKRQVMEDSPLMDVTSNGNKAKGISVPMEKCNEVNLIRRNFVACKTSVSIQSQCIHSEADSTDLGKSHQELVNFKPDSSVEFNINNNCTTPGDILTRLRNVVLRQKRSVMTQVDFLNMGLRGSVEEFDGPENREHVALFDALRDALK